MTKSTEQFIKYAKDYLDGAYQNEINIKDKSLGVIIIQLINTCTEIIGALEGIKARQDSLERRQLAFENDTDRNFKALQKRIGSLERG